MIINKKEIGKYLEKLRIKKRFTRKKIATLLNTSEKSIMDWEKEEVLPHISALSKLADIYKVTVDDILNCGKAVSLEDLYDKYPLLAPFEYRIEKGNLCFNRPKQILMIYKRIKELVKKYNKEILSRNDDLELEFLFKRSCDLKKNYYDDFQDNQNDKYVSFSKLLFWLKTENYDDEEYYYEARRYFLFVNVDLTEFKPYPLYGYSKDNKIYDDFYKTLEPWEKDKLLALFQNSNVIEDISSDQLAKEEYELKNNKEFSFEEAAKCLMKYFIENGACLQPWYFTYKRKIKIEHDVLMSLENMYVDYKKPFFVKYDIVHDDETIEPKYAYIKNNEFTRFVNNFYDEGYYIDYNLDKTVDEVYQLLLNGKESDFVEIFYQRMKYRDDKKDIKYSEKKERVLWKLERALKAKDKFLTDINEQKAINNKLSLLVNKLKNEEYKYYDYKIEDITKDKNFSHKRLSEHWMSLISYQEYLKSRDCKKTKELFNRIDELSLDEIRNIYFPKEEYVKDE